MILILFCLELVRVVRLDFPKYSLSLQKRFGGRGCRPVSPWLGQNLKTITISNASHRNEILNVFIWYAFENMLPACRCGSFTQPGTASRASSFYLFQRASKVVRPCRPFASSTPTRRKYRRRPSGSNSPRPPRRRAGVVRPSLRAVRSPPCFRSLFCRWPSGPCRLLFQICKAVA